MSAEDQASEPTDALHGAPLDRLSRAEILLGAIAVVVIVGWIFTWARSGFRLFDWFPALSFFASLALVAYVVLKALAVLRVPPKVDAKVVPVLSLVPMVGFVVESVRSLPHFLTTVGSILLAYLSATIYWRRQLVDLPGAIARGSAPPAGEPGVEPDRAGDGSEPAPSPENA